MEENQGNKNEQSKTNISSEEVKNEAEQTIKEVKNTFKNTNFKKDSEAAKGFFLSF